MNPTSGNERQWQSPGLASWRYKVGNLTTSTQIAFKNILFATDFSSTTELALPYAVEIARRSGATIHAVHVVQPDIYPLESPSEWPKIACEEEEFRKEKRNQLEEELQGLPHEILILEGNVWQNLAHIIEKENVDLVVLGTHGRTGIEKLLLGSVAETIFRQAASPVLTVGPAVSSRATHAAAAELNQILYAADFSPESLAAARYAISLAKEHHAELILLHVLQNAEPGQVNSAFQTLRDVVPLGAGLGSEQRCLVERGAPADTILDVAASHNADMIVLGLRSGEGRLTAATHFARSIAYKVVTRAACPVLTVRG
jgi:nucleotide-binding universal stress UspA family protein